MTGAKSLSAEEYTLADIIDLCLAENDRRFAGYDARLLRPTTMPALARFARFFLRAPNRMAPAAPSGTASSAPRTGA